MGHTGNMIIKNFTRQMCIPLETCSYFGDWAGVDTNPDDMPQYHA